jgi:hypothetical protein
MKTFRRTPKSRADTRLSNLIFLGGRSKQYYIGGGNVYSLGTQEKDVFMTFSEGVGKDVVVHYSDDSSTQKDGIIHLLLGDELHSLITLDTKQVRLHIIPEPLGYNPKLAARPNWPNFVWRFLGRHNLRWDPLFGYGSRRK